MRFCLGLPFLLALTLLGLLSFATSGASRAKAQPLTPLELARICVSECGWDCGDECHAIHISLAARAAWRGIDVGAHARAYARASFGARPRLPGRAWVAGLRTDGREPAHWHGPAWGLYRARWRATLALAGKVLARPRNPCVGGTPMDWAVGSVVEGYRDRNDSHILLDCGTTRNVFLCPRSEHCGEDNTGPHYQTNRYPEERTTVPGVTLGLSRYGSAYSILYTPGRIVYLCSTGHNQRSQTFGLGICDAETFRQYADPNPQAIPLAQCRYGFSRLGYWKPNTLYPLILQRYYFLGHDRNRPEKDYRAYQGPAVLRKSSHGTPE